MTERMDDRALLDVALEAAAVGARIVAEGLVHTHGIRPKFDRKESPIDLVTAIDRHSEREIVAVLRRAGLAIIAEEGSRIEGAPDNDDTGVWYVDPLDGTTCFAHGHPFHCVSIGLMRDGVPSLGVVHAPALGVIWCGGPALGAVRRDLVRGTERPLTVSAIAHLDDALLATGFPYDRRSNEDDNLAAHAAMTKLTQGVLRCGSAALDLALVSDGTCDAYWERKLKSWDCAAGAALVLAAGGSVTDPWGERFQIDAGSVLASNGLIHDAVRSSLAPHIPAKKPSSTDGGER